MYADSSLAARNSDLLTAAGTCKDTVRILFLSPPVADLSAEFSKEGTCPPAEVFEKASGGYEKQTELLIFVSSLLYISGKHTEDGIEEKCHGDKIEEGIFCKCGDDAQDYSGGQRCD